MLQLIIRGVLALSLILTAVSLSIPKVQAGGLIMISKSMYTLNVGNDNPTIAARVRLNSVGTVYKTTNIVEVAIHISNNGVDREVTIKDIYKDSSGGSFGFATLDSQSLKWYKNGAFESNAANNAGCPPDMVCVTKLITGTDWELRYRISGAALPSYKDRLIAFPLKADVNGLTDAIVDVGYVLFTPDPSQTSNITATASSKNVGGTAEYDLGLVVPGVSVGIAGLNQRTPDTLVIVPRQGDAASTPSNRVCIGDQSVTITSNRSGSCVFSAPVSISVGGVPTSSATAYMMVVPTSSIVGSIFVGNSAATAGKVILPGQHIASTPSGSVGGSTAKENVGYAINPDSVSGFVADPAVNIYGNVYLNANLARLKKNPDLLVSAANANAFDLAVTNADYEFVCDNPCTENPLPTFRLKPKGTNGVSRFNLGSSSLTLLGGGTAKPRKDGYVWYVKGNLIIEPGGADPVVTMRNVVGGTVIVEGNLTIKDTSIQPDPVNANPTQPLGFIALGSTTRWELDTNAPDNSVSKLDAVGFFSRNTFEGVTAKNTHQLKLIGSIVASTVNFSGVRTPADADALNLEVVYDQRLIAYPPPGFNLFKSPAPLEKP